MATSEFHLLTGKICTCVRVGVCVCHVFCCPFSTCASTSSPQHPHRPADRLTKSTFFLLFQSPHSVSAWIRFTNLSTSHSSCSDWSWIKTKAWVRTCVLTSWLSLFMSFFFFFFNKAECVFIRPRSRGGNYLGSNLLARLIPLLPLGLVTLERVRKKERKGGKKRPHSCHQSAAGDSVIQADSEKPVNRHSAAAAAIADVF